MTKIKLVGARRYTRDGKTYEAGKVYALSEQAADELLECKDEWGNDYFAEASARDERELESAAPTAPKDEPPGGKAKPRTIKLGGTKEATASKRKAANTPKQPKAKKEVVEGEGKAGAVEV